MATTKIAKVEPVDMKLEVVVFGVSDVDRAKAFYENLAGGSTSTSRQRQLPRRADDAAQLGSLDHLRQGSHVRQAWLGAEPGPRRGRHRRRPRRPDRPRRRRERGLPLRRRPVNNSVESPRVGGRDPQGRSYFSFASFEDPDGNGWLLQEIQTRLPGREWKTHEH
jgi:catechol 2,3-dioxygenase-like lactoylglutathione lyase family enzyme